MCEESIVTLLSKNTYHAYCMSSTARQAGVGVLLQILGQYRNTNVACSSPLELTSSTDHAGSLYIVTREHSSFWQSCIFLINLSRFHLWLN